MGELIFTTEISEELLAKEFRKIFKKKKIAVKLHYGEAGNKTSLGPEYARAIVNVLKRIGAEPFLFDSSVAYGGSRQNPDDHKENAATQGFTEESIGCPLVFSEEYVVVKTDNLEAEVCKPLHDADGMVVLTHVKGHICTGMGGAIKNLGMGGVTKKTKGEIHSKAEACYVDNCTECGFCAKICPFNAITFKDGHPVIGNCAGCDACVDNCPEGALKVKEQPFDLLISEGAQAVIKDIDKVYYINVIKDITKFCDCLSNPGEIIAPDAGILLGTDIVSIDRASIELVNKKAGKNIFKEVHHKEPMCHVEEAQHLSMGKLHYTLKEI